uniref:Uncharacterized protein n=1 Tax=Corethrella appendiculata TaxID=1370023 RepID=U5EPD4_9DIPT
MWKLLVLIVCGSSLVATIYAEKLELKFEESKVVVQLDESGSNFVVKNGDKTVQKIFLGNNGVGSAYKATEIAHGYVLEGNNAKIEIKAEVNEKDYSVLSVSRKNLAKEQRIYDCVDLMNANWFGGPQQKYQYWPIQKLQFNNYSYVSKEADNCAVAERYWFNSLGSYIYVSDETPLFLDQNVGEPGFLCFSAQLVPPYNVHVDTFEFVYKVGVASNARTIHMKAVERVLGKPTGHPNEKMVRYPIWSTWARYKRDIDHKVVLEFADEINKYKFKNSQYELDDDWEICYGALEFRASKFPNIADTIRELKARNFNVTLWIHPFINEVCEPYFTDAKRKGYLVADPNGNTKTQWWNSVKNDAGYVDFSKPEAAEWFSQRLRKILTGTGIDSFKFDAGEASWSPPDPVQNGPKNLHPHIIITDYIRTVGKFGDLVEVRSAFKTQDLPIFLRMIDKDSEWHWNNGLPTLVTTLLQLNMVGYPLVLPDMIGGNGYNDHPPNKEMFIRWLQANVFMPSLQFSYVPWDYDNETIELSRKFCDLHDQYTNVIMERFKLAVSKGDPVNPPIWWIDPEDVTAQRVYDEFLLGEDILAAPVLTENTVARDIYLPKGQWKDGNDQSKTYIGPILIKNHPAPLSVLPYFIRQP